MIRVSLLSVVHQSTAGFNYTGTAVTVDCKLCHEFTIEPRAFNERPVNPRDYA